MPTHAPPDLLIRLQGRDLDRPLRLERTNAELGVRLDRAAQGSRF